MRRPLLLLLLGALAACSSFGDEASSDAGPIDAGAEAATPTDAGLADAPAASDAGVPDAGRDKRVFVTSQGFEGDLVVEAGQRGITAKDGLAAADALCGAEAEVLVPRGSFKAWLSTTTTSAIGRFNDRNKRVNPVDGTTVLKVVGEPPIVAIPTSDGRPSNAVVWTGTLSTGVSAGPAAVCGDWKVITGAFAFAGQAGSTSDKWTQALTAHQCGNTASLYCIEE
ncbi:MAG: hypothetical protein JST00_35225 [Deltaproteobacteria bacterium]|nr:hypothetical protein [Deltaproteobacteria bacterium]